MQWRDDDDDDDFVVLRPLLLLLLLPLHLQTPRHNAFGIFSLQPTFHVLSTAFSLPPHSQYSSAEPPPSHPSFHKFTLLSIPILTMTMTMMPLFTCLPLQPTLPPRLSLSVCLTELEIGACHMPLKFSLISDHIAPSLTRLDVLSSRRGRALTAAAVLC